MIEDLAKAGRAISERLIAANTLGPDYVKLIASDGVDVTIDPTVIPTAMIWIRDCGQAVVVVAIKRQDSDADYLADVSIRPYSCDDGGGRILADALPKSHERCHMVGRTAALALTVYRAERRLLVEQLDLNGTEMVAGEPYVPGPIALVMDEDQWDAKYHWEADENGDCCVIDNTPEARRMLRARGETHVWSEVDGEGGGTYIVAGIRRNAAAFYRCVISRETYEEENIVVRLKSMDDPGGDDDGSE